MPFTGYQDFNPDFGSALQRMLAARPGLSITSGYRDPARQAVLYENALKKYGSEAAARKWVAPPGRSYHNKRLAADLGFASPEDRAWAHANAGNYGLKFPLGNEAWHVELASTRGGKEPTGGGMTIPMDLASAFRPEAEGEPSYFDMVADNADSIGTSSTATRSARQEDTDDPRLLKSPQRPQTAPLESVSAQPQETAAPATDVPDVAALAPLAQLFKVAQIGQPKRPLPLRDDGRRPLPTIGYG